MHGTDGPVYLVNNRMHTGAHPGLKGVSAFVHNPMGSINATPAWLHRHTRFPFITVFKQWIYEAHSNHSVSEQEFLNFWEERADEYYMRSLTGFIYEDSFRTKVGSGRTTRFSIKARAPALAVRSRYG